MSAEHLCRSAGRPSGVVLVEPGTRSRGAARLDQKAQAVPLRRPARRAGSVDPVDSREDLPLPQHGELVLVLRISISLQEDQPVERDRRAVQALDVGAGLADIADEDRGEPGGRPGILPHEATRTAHAPARGNSLFDRCPGILRNSEA